MTEPTPIAIRDLLDRYAGVLLDVFGVLVDAQGALPGARELISDLQRRRQPFRIVTNDASRSTATYANKFSRLGIPIAPEAFVTSGSLLPGYLRAQGLAGKRVLVLGTRDSIDFVAASGALPVLPAAGLDVEAIAVCDDEGFEYLTGIEHALSAAVRAYDAGRRIPLVLPNPDIVYPKGGGELGFTAGAIALLMEAALARRFPGNPPVFARLGKPQPDLFREAARQLGLQPLVMIGDQIETDIAGARAAGIDSALLAGVSRWTPAAPVAPTWLLDRIAP